MENVFVRDDERSEMRFFMRKTGNLRILSQVEYQKLKAMEKDNYEECWVKFKPLTWASSCKLQNASRVIEPTTNMRIFNSDLFVQNKLKAIIDSWSFKTKNIKGDDVQIPVNSENIDHLQPLVADYILKIYSERYEMSEETRKNS